jgi:branched-chain amino acid transport system substrate-binding protein
MLTPSATNAAITVRDGKVQEYVFRSCFVDYFMGTIMATFATDTLNARTAVIYIDNSSDLSMSNGRIFEEVFVRNGGAIVGREAYLARDTDFRATLTRIRTARPDVMFIPGNYPEVALIVRQARELDINNTDSRRGRLGFPETD